MDKFIVTISKQASTEHLHYNGAIETMEMYAPEKAPRSLSVVLQEYCPALDKVVETDAYTLIKKLSHDNAHMINKINKLNRIVKLLKAKVRLKDDYNKFACFFNKVFGILEKDSNEKVKLKMVSDQVKSLCSKGGGDQIF